MGLEKDPWQIGVEDPLAKAGYAVAMYWVFHRWLAKAGISFKRGGIGDDWAVADPAGTFDLLVGQLDVNAIGSAL